MSTIATEETCLLVEADQSARQIDQHDKPITIRELHAYYSKHIRLQARNHGALATDDEGRWLVHIFTSRARVIPWTMVLTTVAIAVMVELLDSFTGGFRLPMGTLSLFGIPVGFLLTWRVTVSHSRWWEGRHAWQTMESVCVDLTLQMRAWCSSDPQLVRKAVRACAALLFAGRHALQTDAILAEEDPDHKWESALLGGRWDRKYNPVFYATDTLRLIIMAATQKCDITPPVAMSMDAKVTQLLAANKTIEILQSQPMPESYVVLLRTLLLTYLCLVPFATAATLNAVATILFQFIISFALMSVEASAAEIERPFDNTYNDLPVNQIVLDCVKHLAGIEEKYSGGAASRDFASQ